MKKNSHKNNVNRLIVQKYGGSSLASLDHIRAVARRIISAIKQGNHVLVVLSAMGEETDRLLKLSHDLVECPSNIDTAAYDMLLASGEQVSIALMSMALRDQGYKAKAYTGWQAGIVTSSHHTKARIKYIDRKSIFSILEQGIIPIVAGFQGVSESKEITTLGRGGSDTTAVAMAVALKADECQIYTDVDGVYTADPRIVQEAKLLHRITFEEMLELASLGAKVLQLRSVEFAGKYNVPLRVLSSFNIGHGTLITYEQKTMEQPLVSGVTYDPNQASISLEGLPNNTANLSKLFALLSEAHILVDMIVQSASQKKQVDVSFTVVREDYDQAIELIKKTVNVLGWKNIRSQRKVAKLSIVGVGMRSHLGVASTLFEALAKENIDILLISTSEIKISVLVEEKYLELGTRILHAAFKLD